MSKKRKTRQEKIILQLKRQLGQKKTLPASALEPKFELSQEAISKEPQTEPPEAKQEKRVDTPAFSGDLRLNKRDLLKTLILTLFIISFEFVLYLKLR